LRLHFRVAPLVYFSFICKVVKKIQSCVLRNKRSQYVLLLCSTQDCIFLTTLLLTLIIIGKWSEDSFRLVLIEKYVFVIPFMTSNYISFSLTGQYVGILDIMSSRLLIMINNVLWSALLLGFASLDSRYWCLAL